VSGEGLPAGPERGSAPPPEPSIGAGPPEVPPEPPPPPAGPPPTPKKKSDPWAHRRGEPRIFAFVWTVYLFLATAATMLSTVAKGFPGPEVMRPAARVLLLTVALGIALVWPVIRLSQARDRSPVSATAQDLFVVLIPIQAVVWPQSLWWLAHWPLRVVAAEASLLAAWALVIGGALALGLSGRQREGPPGLRWGWMAGIVALVSLGTLPALAADGRPIGGGDVLIREIRPSWMLSPFTAVLELSRDRSWSGLPAGPTEGHWLMILATAVGAAPLWLAAVVRSHGGQGRAGAPGGDGGRGGRSGGVRGGSEGPAGLAAGGG
jgi:hypothetical protein